MHTFAHRPRDLSPASADRHHSAPPEGQRAERANPIWHRLAFGVQAKLTVGAPGDAYEEEADRVAEQVMRMPEPGMPEDDELPQPGAVPAIQRLCADCEDELARQPLLQEDDEERARARIEPGTEVPEVGAETEHQVRQLRGGGRPLPASARAFFEPRLGHDLGPIRVHEDAPAAGTARALRAQAFTRGPDLVFGPGRYAPETETGRRLLAHELVHGIQQGAVRPLSGRPGATAHVSDAGHALQRTPDDDEDADAGGGGAGSACDERETNPIIWFQHDSTLLRSDRRVNSAVHLAAMIRRVREHLDLAGGLGHARLTGYASREGTAAHNLDLSQRRADTAVSLLEGAGIPRTALTGVGRGEDRTFPGLEYNRRVEVCLTPPIDVVDMPPETIEGENVDCAHPPSPVPSLAAYASLVACIEAALPHLGPRDMLDLLRRAYYGSQAFNEAVGCTTAAGLAGLGALRSGHPNLHASLLASKVVSGVDLGHVFTGLEGMVCPTATTTLNGPLGIDVFTAMPNEEFLTWGGDLGSAAAARTFDEIDNGIHHGPSNYFGTPGSMASAEDMRGDIDSYVIRAGLSGACGGSRMTRLPALTMPMSLLLLGHYAGVGAHNVADRIPCFVEAIGGRISGSRITNKRALVAMMQPRVESFAQNFYLKLVTVPLFAIGVPEAIALFRYSREFSELFVDWLESRL